MSLKIVSSVGYNIEFVAGDSEYIRLNVLDQDNNPVLLGDDFTGVLGIKRKPMDTAYIAAETVGTMFDYEEYTRPYGVEFKFTSADTLALLNYDGKERKKLVAHYDIELTQVSTGDVVTILAGTITINRSISGVVI